MNKNLNINRSLIALGVVITLFVILLFLMKSPLLMEYRTMDLAISLDLVFTIPLIYFLLIRKTHIPKTTLVPVLIIGLLLGLTFLPPENQFYLNLFKLWVLPFIELSIMAYVIFKIRSARKAYKSLSKNIPDFFSALKKTCAEFLPSAAVIPFATEVAIIYYGFVDWKKRPLKTNEFTYHKKTGSISLYAGLIILVCAETIGLHVLLSKWNEIIAWVLTGLSFYAGLQLLGIAKSLTKRPIILDDDGLILKYGIISETNIPISAINSIHIVKSGYDKSETIKSLSPLSEIEGYNMVIELNKEYELTGLYGMKRKFKTITFHIDEPEIFKSQLEALQSKNLPHDN